MNLPRRPLVVVEDHLYHIDEILGLFGRRAPGLLSRLTVVCLDRPGPDTRAAIERWASAFPQVLVVADVSPGDGERHLALPAEALAREKGYVDAVAGLLAPRGVLVQDIQLEPLRFLEPDAWWETIYLAANVRGRYGSGAPRCVFMSNKRAFEATFGKKLRLAGFDEDDVLSKDELEDTLVPLVLRSLRESLPLALERSGQPEAWVCADDDETQTLDLVLWEDRAEKVVLTGRALAKGRLELASSTHEAATWRALVDTHLDGSSGVSIAALGIRVAPQDALRAEQSNAASRHAHKLRGRLLDKSALVTVEQHYRFADHLRVGRIRRRPRSSGLED